MIDSWVRIDLEIIKINQPIMLRDKAGKEVQGRIIVLNDFRLMARIDRVLDSRVIIKDRDLLRVRQRETHGRI